MKDCAEKLTPQRGVAGRQLRNKMDSRESLLTQLRIERLRLMAMMRLHNDSLKGSVMVLAGGMSERQIRRTSCHDISLMNKTIC